MTPRVAMAAAAVLAMALAQRDADVVQRIRTEAAEHSSVMDTALHLSDANGPRLTGGAGFNAAMAWAAERLRALGAGVHTESFPWGVDWSSTHISLDLVAPDHASLLAFPMTWSAGTAGRIEGEVFQPATDIERYEESAFDEIFREIAGHVRGRFVLLQGPGAPAPPDAPASRRLTGDELMALESPPPPRDSGRGSYSSRLPFLLLELMQRLKREGAAGVLWRAGGGAGVVDVDTLSTAYREVDTPAPVPIVYVAAEQYNRIARLVGAGVPVRVALDLAVRRSATAVRGMNLIADFPGTAKPKEIVMLGAHLDSWPSATGATDNAAGCAMVLEAARILRALNLRLDRTVRVALWGGEEGARAGSNAYVRAHEADRLAAYFNVDAGSGKVRGIYAESDTRAVPIFREWLAALADADVRTVSPRRPTGRLGSDDGAFVDAGLPGFAFIQDPLDYGRTHHTNIDVYDRLQAADLKQAAAVVAAVAYAAATYPEPLPRH